MIYAVIEYCLMVIRLKKAIFMTAILFIFTFVFLFDYHNVPVFKDNFTQVIIDAGHGLPDGGAVASDGTIESDINLKISKALNNKLESIGIECLMIRDDEYSIYDKGETIHAKKVSDIKNRVKICEENSNALLISIHMNTYPDEKVRGAQVFYKRNCDLSKNVADELQNALNLNFQPNFTKKAKEIPSNVYLFKNIKNKCMLVECGFLTNKNDLKNFKSDEFIEVFTNVLAETIAYKITGSDVNV